MVTKELLCGFLGVLGGCRVLLGGGCQGIAMWLLGCFARLLGCFYTFPMVFLMARILLCGC